MPSQYTIGVDIGATKIIAGLVQNGKILRKERFLTKESQKTDRKTILKTIISAVDSVWMPKISGIGLGFAGTTDQKRGLFVSGFNFPKSFRNIPVTREMKKFRVPVVIDNDVHCFTLGETIYGAGKGYRNVFGMTIGTGLGGALVIDGKIYRGRNNAAGEIGHTVIAVGENKSESHSRLESFASGTGLSRMITERYTHPFPAEELEKRAAAGDRVAEEIISSAGHAFAVGCANVVLTVNPDIIVVGGGLARVRGLWKVLRSDFRGLIPYEQMRTTPIVKSKLSHDANVLGASALIDQL